MSDQLQVHGPRFTIVPDWVLALPLSSAGFRLYVVLLSFAGKDSTSFPSLRAISERMCGASPRQLRRLRAELEKSGLLTVIERTRENGSQTSNLYVVNTLPNPHATWYQMGMGEEDTGVRGDPDTDDRGIRTPVSPPEGESVEVESGGRPPRRPPPARASAALTVDKRRASVEEMELGGTLLEMWNGLSGQRLRSPDFVKLFIRRCREHPEVTLEQHESLIRSLLTDPDPWWQGHPSPNLIYGSSAQFERQLTTLEAPARQRRRYGTGVTTGELAQLADKLRREGR